MSTAVKSLPRRVQEMAENICGIIARMIRAGTGPKWNYDRQQLGSVKGATIKAHSSESRLAVVLGLGNKAARRALIESNLTNVEERAERTHADVPLPGVPSTGNLNGTQRRCFGLESRSQHDARLYTCMPRPRRGHTWTPGPELSMDTHI
ncbi:hypothetical protein CMUS01_07903 [Colletotrichum musicola]|uniref:Uncharacterized protein n=1 Tax=Colletotrichum musicola TaxID=2175873 RepID=A0A8H6NEY5_9PEZI|nr:hypothetical protein CMUS01_07903 [Colletotrichum musicola]